MPLELEHWHAVLRDCGRAIPGVGHGNERVMDLSKRETTPDQQRIEAVLETWVKPGTRILHVGVGNSSLGMRFAPRVACILGLTVSIAEKRHGDALAIPGYRIALVNKYSNELSAIDGPFDIIIDNNPSSFGCCVRHFEAMLVNYARLLVPGGAMLTDRVGMGWCYEDGPMRLRFQDLEAISAVYPFDAERVTDDVYALRRRRVARAR